ncbi:hypothetical protein A2U01_0067969, partial [Trifolium medium]|nr:hypothetical protein [Trifolium medium]
HPPESLPRQAAPRHPPQPRAQSQDVAQPHVQAQQPQAQAHLMAQAVSEAHAYVSGDPPPLSVLLLFPAIPTLWRPFL